MYNEFKIVKFDVSQKKEERRRRRENKTHASEGTSHKKVSHKRQ